MALGPFILIILFLVFPLLGVPIYFLRLRNREPQAPGPSVGTIVTWIALMASLFIMMADCSSHIEMEAGRSEARKNLQSISNAMSQYHSRTSEYPAGSNAFEFIEWSALNENRYSYFCGGDVYPNVLGKPIQKKPGAEWPFTVSPGASPTGFTCMAVGNVDGDEANDAWSIDDTGEVKWVTAANEPGPGVLAFFVPVLGLSLVSFPIFLAVNVLRIRRERRARSAVTPVISE
jgi:hypothetical protein